MKKDGKKLSKYVFKTVIENKKVLYNTVSKKILPFNSNEKKLKEYFFLEGQEKKSIYSRLFSIPKVLQLYIIPTWGCNLRCPFCYVLDKLDNTENNYKKIYFKGFYNFIKQYCYKYSPITINFVFLGGEPLSDINNCSLFLKQIENIEKNIKIKCIKSITTNFTINLEKKHIFFLKKMDKIVVSVDGTKKEHNRLRKIYKNDSLKDPFMATISNIYKLPKKIKNKIKIQAACQDNFFKKSNIKEYYFIFDTIGINKDQIKIGLVSNTKYFNSGEKSLDYLSGDSFFLNPCCIFRYMSFFTIDLNGISMNYFDNNQNTKLSDLQDRYDFNNFEKLYKKHIIENMPVLNDEKCIKCPVIGLCWGKCFGTSCNQNNPSNFCDQKKLVKKINYLTKNKKII